MSVRADDAMAAIQGFDRDGDPVELRRAAELVYRVAEAQRETFAVLAGELFDSATRHPAGLESPEVEKVADLVEFLTPFQEPLRALAWLRFRQRRLPEAAALQMRSLGAEELNHSGMMLRLAHTMDRAR